MGKILIIEDDVNINDLLKEILIQNGYEVLQAYSGTEGIMAFNGNEVQLVLLDQMLPGKTGKEVLAIIRENSHIPVIMLTAVVDKDEVVALLKQGANDYMIKPFDNKELLARIEVQLRHSKSVNKPETTLIFRDIKLDVESYTVTVSKQMIHLSKREFEILACLIRYPKKVFTKENLYEVVWGNEFYGDDNIVNVHMSKIRSKLKQVNAEDEYIQTVWGIGFKMVDS